MATKEDIESFKNYLNMWFSPEWAKIKVMKDRQRAEKQALKDEENRKREEWNKKSFWEKAMHYAWEGLGFARNVAGSALWEVPAIVWNVWKFASDVTTAPLRWLTYAADALIPDSVDGGNIAKVWDALSSIWDWIQAWWDYLKEWIKDLTWVERWSVGDTVWSVGAQIGSFFVPGGQARAVWLVSKWLNLADKSGKALNLATNLATKWKNLYDKVWKVKYIWNLAQNSLKWAADMAKFSVISKWEITKDDLTNGAVLGGGLHIAWKGLNSVRNVVGKKIPEKLMVTNLVNPSDLKNINERLSKLGQGEVKAGDLSKWMLKNGIKWSKEEIQSQLSKWIDLAKTKVEELLSTNTTKVNNSVTDWLKKTLSENLYNYTHKVWAKLLPTAWNEAKVEAIQNLISKNEMTFKEINEARRMIWENLFKQTWSLKESVSQEWWQNVWKNTSKFLDDNVENFRKYNKNIEVWRALKEAIAKKESNEAVKQLASYMWFWAITWWSSLFMWSDPLTATKNAVIWWLLWVASGKVKNILNSPGVTTRIWTLLSKLAPKDAEVVKNFINTWKVSWFSSGFSDRLKKVVSGLSELKNWWNLMTNKKAFFNPLFVKGKEEKAWDKWLLNSNNKYKETYIYDTIPDDIIKKLENEIWTNKNSKLFINAIAYKTKKILKANWIEWVKWHIITTNWIKHIEKRHWKNAKLQQNEIPVTMEDIKKIPLIIKEPDDVKISNKLSRSWENVIIYKKDVWNIYYYLEAVEDSSEYLTTKTMYINKK